MQIRVDDPLVKPLKQQATDNRRTPTAEANLALAAHLRKPRKKKGAK